MFLHALAASLALCCRAPSAPTNDRVLHFTASDGTPLEAKLSVPAGASGAVPVVFLLHGAGPRNFDHALQYRDAAGQRQVTRYYDYFAGQLADRGVAVFRMSKRGCSADPATGRPIVDRAVFSTATPTVLLDDYRQALEALRRQGDVDASRIVLLGSSEGTRLAPRLALASPGGIVGMVLASYSADPMKETVIWQNSVGPWRNIQKLIPAAADDRLTRAEYDQAVAATPVLAPQLPFALFDVDKDSTVTPSEVATALRPRLNAIVGAVHARNDELIWQAVANLTSAYLREEWEAPPTVEQLLRVTIPIGIFHGDLDGSTRVEGVRETADAFQRAGRTNLTVRIYPGYDHDLNWTPAVAASGGPPPRAATCTTPFSPGAGHTRHRPPREPP